jgi:hypothetical protein
MVAGREKKGAFRSMLEFFWNAAYSRRATDLFQNNFGGYTT